MIPAFEEAIANFREFLKDQGVPDDVIWVAPEHTICCGMRDWKIFQDESASASEISAKYHAARAKGLGVRFCVLCTDDQVSYCYMDIPVDGLDAEYKLLANGCLKLSIPKRMASARVIKRGRQSIWYQAWEAVKFRKWKNIAFRVHTAR